MQQNTSISAQKISKSARYQPAMPDLHGLARDQFTSL
jgi:hypothetical protein